MKKNNIKEFLALVLSTNWHFIIQYMHIKDGADPIQYQYQVPIPK